MITHLERFNELLSFVFMHYLIDIHFIIAIVYCNHVFFVLLEITNYTTV